MTSVKGQILADFLLEKPDENLPETPAADIPQEPWTIFTYGSSCIDRSGAGLILASPEGTEFTYALRFQFTASNSEAEYEALIAGLQIAAQMGVRNVHISVDSKLVANQVLGAYVAKEQNIIKYLEKVKSLVSSFASFSISQVPRSKNKKADALSKIASTMEEEGITWMTPIIEYLKDGTLPGDRKEASKLRIKARQYKLLEGVLYKRSFLKPWLRCVGPLQADYVIREIHEGSCSMNA
ncbi:reverse transcriptase domain-containing protein [Tanacetum coccineum]